METQPVGTSLAYDYSFRSVSFSSLTATVVRRTQHQTKSQDYCRLGSSPLVILSLRLISSGSAVNGGPKAPEGTEETR